MDKYKKGYDIISFPTESLDGGVNGLLRKGDMVDVYTLNPETELLELLLRMSILERYMTMLAIESLSRTE